jgi:general secretion pathway protein C
MGASALPKLAALEDVPKSAAAAVPDPRRVNYAPIFERNLFGSEPLAAPDSVPTAAANHGDLILKGTARVNGRGFAVFTDRDSGKQDVFAVGERVFDGPKLVEVEPTKATLLANGRRITLEIAEGNEPANVGKSKAAAATGAVGGIKRNKDGSYLVDRREVDHSIENLSTVITKMRAVPYMKDGESLGFRVFNIRPNSIFERMGLKNGDVIQNVNGSELRDPQKALGLLDSIASSDEIRIDLLRNQRPSTLTYIIR